jgi:hypothetical protein
MDPVQTFEANGKPRYIQQRLTANTAVRRKENREKALGYTEGRTLRTKA